MKENNYEIIIQSLHLVKLNRVPSFLIVFFHMKGAALYEFPQNECPSYVPVVFPNISHHPYAIFSEQPTLNILNNCEILTNNPEGPSPCSNFT